MAFVNLLTKEITLKIAYHGPGLGGKTTNLRWLESTLPASQRGDLLTLDTATERTLFFDFMLVKLGSVEGFATRLHLFTVPGQAYYDASRKLILRGVDAVVFVVDSQPERLAENEESLRLLAKDLADMGVPADEIPVVVQYNKRDMPDCVPVEDLEPRFNPTGAPYFQAIARHGVGVMPTLRTAVAAGLAGLDPGTAR